VDDLYLYVCDYNNGRIQVFDKSKNFAFHHTWGQREKKNGYSMQPSDILVWDELIFVSRTTSILVFTKTENNFVKMVGKEGTEEFGEPKMMLMNQNLLYVCDRSNYRIQVLK